MKNEMKYKPKFRIAVLLMVFILFFMIIPIQSTFASEITSVDNELLVASNEAEEGAQTAPNASGGWVGDDPAGIYGTKDKEITYTEKSKDDPNMVEKWIIGLLKSPGVLLNNMESKVGMNIDQIVYGRILPEGKGVNNFKFELVKGNFYGVVGSYIYNIMRMICIVVLWGIFAGQLLKMMIASNSSKYREDFKAALQKMTVITVLFYLMPYVWQLAQYCFDIILYMVYGLSGSFSSGSTMSGGASTGLLTLFEEMADDSWFNALLYVGVVVLALYFAFTYLGVAMGMFIYYLLFPLVCVFSYADKNVLTSWVKNVFASMLVPVIDALLLILPAAAYGYLNAKGDDLFTGLMTFALCCLVIPCRNLVKNILGINMGGIGAIAGAGLSAMAMMKGAQMLGRGVRNVAGHGKNAIDAHRKGKMYDEMAKAEEDEQKSRGGAGMDYDTAMEARMAWNNPGQDGKNADDEGENGKINDSDSGQAVNDGGSLASGGMGDTTNSSESNADKDLDTSAPIAPVAAMSSYRAGDTKMAGEYAKTRAAMESQKSREHRNMANDLMIEKDRIDEQISALERSKGKTLGDAIMFNGKHMGYTGFSGEENQSWNDMKNASENTQNIINENMSMAREYDNKAAEYNTMASDMGYRSASLASRKQQIADKYASLSDVHSPAFNNLSPAKQAQLMKKYARREASKAVFSGAGAVAGGATAFGATTFFSASTKAMAMGAGVSGGAGLGSGVVNVATGVKNVGSVAYNHFGDARAADSVELQNAIKGVANAQAELDYLVKKQ